MARAVMAPDTTGHSGRRHFLKAAGAATITGLTAGCVASLQGGGTTNLTIAIPHYGFNWDTSMPFVVGQDQGFFEEEGLSLSKVEVGGGGKNVRAVVAGDAQIALGTGTFAIMSAYKQGTGIRMIANQVAAATDLIWIAKEGSEFQELEDLRGASGVKVGFSSPGSSTNMVALGAIEHLNLQDSEAVAIGGMGDSLAAVRTDEVDVGHMIPEIMFDEERSEGLQIVFHGKNIPPFGDLTIRANLAEASWLENNGDAVESYLRARQQTMEWAYDNISEAAQILGEQFDVSNAQKIVEAFNEFGAYAREDLRMDRIANIGTVNDLAVQHGFLDNKLSQSEVNEMIDTTYLPSTDGDTFS